MFLSGLKENHSKTSEIQKQTIQNFKLQGTLSNKVKKAYHSYASEVKVIRHLNCHKTMACDHIIMSGSGFFKGMSETHYLKI